jgi:gamma-glutamyltranspeptidase / glutathione hydrolase
MPQASVLSPNLSRRLTARKPSVRTSGGIVVTQHRLASEAGARVLKAGGHAVDAAVAAAFVIGVAEPWMSGIGGVGGMLVHDAATGKTTGFDFGGRSPKALRVADFQMMPGADSDLFGWPAVKGNINTVGPKAVVTPSQPLGLWTAHKAFGRRKWADLLAPAVALAAEGITVDWHTTLLIATAMGDLAKDGAAAERFLRGGLPPVAPTANTGTALRLPAPALAKTLATLAAGGATALYEGPLADSIAADMKAMGGYLTADDLASCRVQTVDPLRVSYRDRTIAVLPELNGGPTLAVAFDALGRIVRSSGARAARLQPGAADYLAYAQALQAAWQDRFTRLGDSGERSAPTCTTHLSVVDREGNMVTLTQTLLSLFGSRVVLPSSGILMNNGVNWFDPRPGGPNAIGPDRRVLANYVPAIMSGPDGMMAVGGCGGRKIIPAVFQLLAMQADFGLDLDRLFRTARLDVSGGPAVVTDSRMTRATLRALDAAFETVLAEQVVYSNPYTVANAVRREDGVNEGAAEVLQPWAEAVGEDEV